MEKKLTNSQRMMGNKNAHKGWLKKYGLQKKTDKEKLYELISYIESRVKCVEEMDYPFQMAFTDIVHVAEKLDSRPTPTV